MTARTPLLLLPGTLCDARLFGGVRRMLAPRVVTVGNVAAGTSVGAIAQAVLRQAPERFALAGFSFGGILALEVWRSAPLRVAGIALLDTTYRAESPAAAARRAAEIECVAAGGTAALRSLLRSDYLPGFFAAGCKDAPGLHDAVLQMAAACGPAVLERQWRALMCRPDSKATLPTINVPSLVLCGEEDRLCPPALHEEMASVIGVPCHRLAGCGHFTPLEAPRRAAVHLDAWLAAVDDAERRSAEFDGRLHVAC